ncbi:radical SAM protein [Clostridium akagii]|uniref:radical SAM protein n=1 Tax=Clostridium akagii TaxID=91623 RepID=UPI000B28CBA0|nr:radical SAM protein [Clostridium akagii]
MLNMLNSCKLCPRNCNVNRLKDELGFCKSGSNLSIARVSLHKWEEPCISGTKGSGTIFFSNCNLKCVFCQNHEISQEQIGKEISIKRLSEIFMEQQNYGAHNINLVTPTHFVPQIIESIKLSRRNGLSIPILYNSNGYENVETIKSLEGYIDIYLPDLKYINNKFAEKYSMAQDYFKFASCAIDEMVSQAPNPVFNENGIMLKGVIIRHLMLPGLLFDSKKIVDYIYKKYGDNVYLSLMNQYTPMFNAAKYPEINKPLNKKHYESLIDYCRNLGFKNAFIQEEGTAKESFVPHFDLSGV